MEPQKVTLGGSEYDLVPQKIGRIRRKLTQVWELFSGTATGDMPTEIGPGLHDALAVFIPNLEPYWKLAGYPNEGEYQRRLDHDAEVGRLRQEYAASNAADSFAELPEDVRQGFEAPDFEEAPYEGAADHSPTPPELIEACETIYRIHGGERLQKLFFGLVKPESIRGYIDSWIESQSVQQLVRTQQKLGDERSRPSPNSPQRNGGLDPTTSSTRVPISAQSGDSPPLD